jgi:hypothetical protein
MDTILAMGSGGGYFVERRNRLVVVAPQTSRWQYNGRNG